ncbi:MAG: hypothetical protein V4538_06460 [Bacteroidota bacterium]
MKNNLFKYSILFLIISLFIQTAKTQEVVKEKAFKHGIGAGIGYTTGYGLSYKYSPNLLAVQVNFAPYHNNELDRYSVGVTLMYTLVKNNLSSLFIYQGNHFYYNSEMVTIYETDPNKPYNPNPPKQRVTDQYFNNGVGFGVDVTIAKRISFNLMAGYAFYNNFKQINLTGETALHYKF